MSKPRLLDTFCCAGGCSEGYRRAGFEPYGIDIEEQPHYPFPFLQMDALESLDRLIKGGGLTFSNGATLYLKDFVAIHASPPCQGYSTTKNCSEVFGFQQHPLYLGDVRERLVVIGKPYVIENVSNAKYRKDKLKEGLQAGFLCGTMFGMPFYRHRLFETSFFWMQPGHPKHNLVNAGSYGAMKDGKIVKSCSMALMHNLKIIRDSAAFYFGTPWMNGDELTEAIPSIYTEYIGKYLMQVVMENSKEGVNPKAEQER